MLFEGMTGIINPNIGYIIEYNMKLIKSKKKVMMYYMYSL